MKKLSGIAVLIAFTVFTLSAAGDPEDSTPSRVGATENPPPIDLHIAQNVETATFALG